MYPYFCFLTRSVLRGEICRFPPCCTRLSGPQVDELPSSKQPEPRASTFSPAHARASSWALAQPHSFAACACARTPTRARMRCSTRREAWTHERTRTHAHTNTRCTRTNTRCTRTNADVKDKARFSSSVVPGLSTPLYSCCRDSRPCVV
eukprot:1283253-Pleurochrysis_carterae.AAC.2